MAKEEDDDGKGKKEADTKKGSNTLLFIIIGVLVLIIIGGGVAFMMMGKSTPHASVGEGEADEPEADEDVHAGELPGYIMPLETFIVNLSEPSRFLKVTIALGFQEPEAPAGAEESIPKMRDAIIRVVSSKKATDVLSNDGKDRLAQEMKYNVNKALGGELVDKVYFTEFIVQ